MRNIQLANGWKSKWVCETLKLLNAYGIKVYRTDKSGEISITINREGGVKIDTNV